MDISSLTGSLAINSSVDSLESRKADVPIDHEAGQQMESMFASMLIKTMRETLGEEGLFPGDKADALGGLFDQFMGEQIVQGEGLGIGKLMAANAHRTQPSNGE